MTIIMHRCRKMLKVEGAKDTIACEARAKFLRPRPFLHDRGYCTMQLRVSR